MQSDGGREDEARQVAEAEAGAARVRGAGEEQAKAEWRRS
jgi:hypothetical protein